MSDTPNVALARRLYDSKADPVVAKEIMSPDTVWDITPGFPYGGVYEGWDSVSNDFFGRLMPLFATMYPVGDQFFADDDDHVFVLGHYHVESKDGQPVDVRFIHLWTVRDGKLAKVQQAADSQVLQHLLSA